MKKLLTTNELIEHMKSKPGVAIGPALDISRLAREGMGE